MESIQEKINSLSDTDIARLMFWVFDEQRDKLGGDLAHARMCELASWDISAPFNMRIQDLGIGPLNQRPSEREIVNTFRIILMEQATHNPDDMEDLMGDLGMEAGGFELTEILKNIDIPHLILILILLKPHFKCAYLSKNKRKSIEFSFGSSESLVRQFLKKLPIFNRTDQA